MENDFQKINRLLRCHWAAITCAVVFATLLMAPFISSRISLGSEFHSIEPVTADDEAFYLSRVREVLDGYPTIGNSYLAEHKDAYPQQLFVPEYVLAQLTRITNLAVPQARIAIACFLGMLAFLSFYYISAAISGSKIFALFSSIFFFFGLYPGVIMRPVSPQFNIVFWLLAIAAAWHLTGEHITRRLLVIAAIAIGVLFYIYPYYWTWFVVFLLVLSGLYLFWERRHAIVCLIILASSCVLGSGYAVLTFIASRSPEYTETMTRLGMITTRFPSGAMVLIITGIGLAILFLLIRHHLIVCNRNTLFFIAAFLASIIVVNQHIVTGKNFEFSNHYTMQTVTVAIFASGFVLRHLMYKWRRYILVAGVILVTGFVIFSCGKIFVASTAVSANMVYRQDYAEIFQWLNAHAADDSVVYANDDLSYWIPVYTSKNVFFSRNAGFFLVSDAELEKRFLAQHFFDNIDEKLIREQERALVGVRYVDQIGHVRQQNKLRRLLGMGLLPEPSFPEIEVQRILKAGHAVQKNSFKQALQPYDANYFIWDTLANPQWKLQNQGWLIPVFRYKQFTIFSHKLS